MAKKDNAPEKQDASIIGEKYRDRYSPENRDFVGSIIDASCTSAVTKDKVTKDEDGNEVTETVVLKRRELSLEALFSMAESNGIDTAKYREQADRPNAPGRLRMTLGNMLRARAKRRHGIYDSEGTWHDAPADFIDGAEKTEEPDGTKITPPKVEAEAA